MVPMRNATLASLVAAGIWLFWKLCYRWFRVSALDNVPGPSAQSFLKGNMQQLLDRHGGDFQEEIGNRYGSIVKFHGLLGGKALYVYDPTALRSILVDDQDAYEEAANSLAMAQLIFGYGLLSTVGAQHTRQRRLMKPVFSADHMRYITPVFYSAAHRLCKGMETEVGTAVRELDILRWMGRVVLEIVGQGGLGYSFDPLVSPSSDVFGQALKAITPAVGECGNWRALSEHYKKLGPPTFRRFLASIAPDNSLKRLKSVIDTIDHRSKEIYNKKLTALKAGDEFLKQQVGEGRDIMSLLLKANMEAPEKDKLPDEELIAQMATLVFAATDTTSNAISQVLQLLADNQPVQEKLREEINGARHGHDIPYDDLMILPYLDAVCKETLRLHPTLSSVLRECQKEVILPLSQPIIGRDGSPVHEIVVPPGTLVVIGIRSCNRNKALWGEDALEWNPERWLRPLPKAINNSKIPGVFAGLMTFIGGPRSCIGYKYALLEIKLILSVLLERFKFTPTGKNIVWNLAGVNFPTVDCASTSPSLPLLVEAIKKNGAASSDS